jgi:CRISPR-associated endonuclease/helicase Cas3
VRDAKGNRLHEPSEDGRPMPCLWILGPKWTTQPTVDWYGAMFEKGQYVYRDHGQLWLSAKVLQKGSFAMPADARDLIETVFAEAASLPDALKKNALKARGQEMSEASLAQQNTLKIEGGYRRGDIGDWWGEAKTPSRLGEEMTEIVLAKWTGKGLQRWADGAWQYSMVKVAARRLARVDAPINEPQTSAYACLLKGLPGQGKWSVLLPLLQRADGVWHGQAWTMGNGKTGVEPKLSTWFYDVDFGLRMENPDTAKGASDQFQNGTVD